MKSETFLDIRGQILKVLSQVVSEFANSAELDVSANEFTLPPKPELGELAYGCFQLAKKLKKPPNLVAQELADKFSKTFLKLGNAQAMGPYVNFRLSLDYLGKNLLEPILTGEFFNYEILKSAPKTMLEYSQPNTHKELHVGHLRNLCMGLSLSHLLREVGVDLTTATFPGDLGMHVAKCLWYLKYHNDQPSPKVGRGEWLGKMYSLAHLKLEDEEKSNSSAKENANSKAQLTFILKQLENKSGEFYELWQETRAWSLELMNQIYQWAGAQFDRWYWESEVDEASLIYVRNLLDKGLLIKSEGAVGMDLSSENLGFCMLMKSDGTGLYATKDLELARRKFEEFKIERSIYLVDIRQSLHFSQVFKTLEKLGYVQAKNCLHLSYNFVELPDGAMSSRKGNIEPVLRVIADMENQVRTQFLSRYTEEWSKEEIDKVAKLVAEGAIKYGMLKIDGSKKIVFNRAEWLKIDGDSGPFIQYSVARIKSLIKKSSTKVGNELSINWNLLSHPSEQVLIQQLCQYHKVIQAAAEGLRPSLLCTYLFGLAQSFNHFYHECPIHKAESPDLMLARLQLSLCAKNVLEKGLSLLGIQVPDRM
jgi:arginyl-tRNA synthetase